MIVDNLTDLIPVRDEVQSFLNKTHRLLIGGNWVEAAEGETFEVINPADKKVISHVARGRKEDVQRAVAAARKTFDSGVWHRKIGPRTRGKMIWQLADLMESRADDFAQLESLDNGKSIKVARGADVQLAIDMFRHFAGYADKLGGETIPTEVPYTPGARYLNYTLREPVGVVGQIIPWNFPLLMAAWKVAPALACGNCVVLKPAEQTPLSAILLGELIQEVGFPAGTFNLVNGFGDAGAALAAHMEVDKVAFTGSTEVGYEIVKASAGNLKRISLELGGKSPNIIYADADIEGAIKGAASAIFFNQGQCCCAGSRLFVERDVYDQTVEGLSNIGKNIRIGPGMHPKTEIGPLVSEEQFRRVSNFLSSGRKDGAKAVVGGNPCSGDLSQGYFVEPTVFTETKPDMSIVCEEIFGPVLTVIPFQDPEEMLKWSNDTQYGLAAGVWTKDVSKAHRTAEMLKAGTVWINCYNMFDAASPFGGYKQSGYGREMGKHVLELYTQVKSVWVGI